ncbi:hypothetical protein P3T27_007959 [Kitasatospora sp. MAA19]|uniref:hypothetical protein n=1 Tax=unclassified Kitasatospora TaxID=2633591 RepID=UPI0024754E87|nr:hypothetical protein [Kitasatospora sp. MAA19]MDH6711206.1 hypothetical protein [Kitasatospora sp. MAA19]
MSDPTPAPAVPGQATGNPTPPPRRWVWTAMTPEDRQQRLGELGQWVDWLIDHHHLHRKIPRCWYRDGHEPVLEILTALYLGWVRTYAGDPSKATTLGEIAWIKELHLLAPALAAPACEAGHQAPPPRPGPTGEALSDWLDTNPDRITEAPYHPAEAEATRLAHELLAAEQRKAASRAKP